MAKKCPNSIPCGASCISKGKQCRVDSPKGVADATDKLSKVIAGKRGRKPKVEKKEGSLDKAKVKELQEKTPNAIKDRRGYNLDSAVKLTPEQKSKLVNELKNKVGQEWTSDKPLKASFSANVSSPEETQNQVNFRIKPKTDGSSDAKVNDPGGKTPPSVEFNPNSRYKVSKVEAGEGKLPPKPKLYDRKEEMAVLTNMIKTYGYETAKEYAKEKGFDLPRNKTALNKEIRDIRKYDREANKVSTVVYLEEL